jgi:hypothetical protein
MGAKKALTGRICDHLVETTSGELGTGSVQRTLE